MAQADADQLVDFPDKTSGQLMSQAFKNISVEARNGSAITAQPWYEDILPAGLGTSQGYANNTQWVAANLGAYLPRGDFADSTEALSYYGVLPPNVGMASQFSENTMYTNKGFSSYNGMLVTLHKNAGYGLQFDLNYTWSHSIDNVSVTANTIAFAGYGFICDVLRPRECRGPSDFDVTNYINGNFIYDLPVGRGRTFAPGAPMWLNEVIGGWAVSGLPSWHTGLPYFAQSEAFIAGYSDNAPAILTGSIADLKAHVHGGMGGPLYGYTNPSAANADYTGPLGFTIGSRNNLRGPGYFNMDLGLAKAFPIWENLNLNFRADAFNAFNHANFATPCSDITGSTCVFGTISSTVSTTDDPFNGGNGARVLQGALRLEF
jgi:hypothetical protein